VGELWILVGLVAAAAAGHLARRHNARDRQRQGTAQPGRPIGTAPSTASPMRSIGTGVFLIGISALLWACVANLAIDPTLSLADNLHWAATRNQAMLWGFGLVLVGLLMRLTARKPAASSGDKPTDRTHRRCPACAEPVLREAVKCKHCGEALVPLPYS
jgi:hypothetical protein